VMREQRWRDGVSVCWCLCWCLLPDCFPCMHACRRQKQLTMGDVVSVNKAQRADESVALCIYGQNMPFNTVRSPLFKRMLRDVAAAGPSYAPPSYNRLRCNKPADGKKSAGLLRVVRLTPPDPRLSESRSLSFSHTHTHTQTHTHSLSPSPPHLQIGAGAGQD
jgi:hypothetical protein